MVVRPHHLVTLLTLPVGLLLLGCGGPSADAQHPAVPSTPSSAAPTPAAGGHCDDLRAEYPDQLETLRALPPSIVRALRKNPGNTAALDEATGVIAGSRLVHDPAAALQRTRQLQRTPPADVQQLIDCLPGGG